MRVAMHAAALRDTCKPVTLSAVNKSSVLKSSKAHQNRTERSYPDDKPEGLDWVGRHNMAVATTTSAVELIRELHSAVIPRGTSWLAMLE